MAAAIEIARSSGLFTVPEVLDCDEVGLKLSVEYIPSFVPLARLDLAGEFRHEILYRVGAALAAIHEGSWTRGDGVETPLFHGDPDGFNIGVDGQGRLTFLDWDPAPGLDRLSLDHREKDIGLIQIYFMTALLGQLRWRPVPAPGFDSFLSGYGGQRPLDGRHALELATEVGTELCQWSNIPAVSLPRKLYYRVIRRVALRSLRRGHPGTNPTHGGASP